MFVEEIPHTATSKIWKLLLRQQLKSCVADLRASALGQSKLRRAAPWRTSLMLVPQQNLPELLRMAPGAIAAPGLE